MNSIALIGLSLASVVFLSLVHVLADLLRWKHQMPQKYWLASCPRSLMGRLPFQNPLDLWRRS